MDVFQTIFSFIVLISLIVGIHELGHFLTARYFGIHVLKFKIGFGKELFTLKDKNNCTYSFGILPLGGYVQMLGENNTYNEEDGHFMENKKSYNEASAGERAAVTVAGPVANFFLAICIYSFLSFIGTMQLSSYVGEVLPNSIAEESGIKIKDKILKIDQQKVSTFNDINLILSKRIGDTGSIEVIYSSEGINNTKYISINNWLSEADQKAPNLELGLQPYIPPIVGSLQDDGPASRYGIEEGDLIESINGKRISSWQGLSNILGQLPNQLLELIIIREQQRLTIMLETSSFTSQDGTEKGRIGILASNNLKQWPAEYVVERKENLFNAFITGLVDTYKYTTLIIHSIGKMMGGSISADNLGGPIQISVLAGSAAKAGYVTFLSMIALLSINLGLLNLLPIPILDGGQLLMIAMEKIKGSPVSDMTVEYSMRIGIVLVVSLMVFAFANDIARLI